MDEFASDPVGIEEVGDDNLVGPLDKPRPLAAMTVTLTLALRSKRASEIGDEFLRELIDACAGELHCRHPYSGYSKEK